MTDRYHDVNDNNTWELVPRLMDDHVIRCMWPFCHKYQADCTLQHYKVHLVVNGKSQQVEVDCDETFIPVVKPTTIRTMFHQLEYKNAFLHGDLHESVYMFQPQGFQDDTNPYFVFRFKKSLYGLKQAPCAWYHRFDTYLTRSRFKATPSDTSLFVYKWGMGLHIYYFT